MKSISLNNRFLVALTMIVLMFVNVSCKDTETTDSTKFALHYAGITDIGPSMSFNLGSPTYIGGVPSNFSITQVTLDDEPYSTECFVVNPDNGSISLSNTEELPTGTYRLTIACLSNGDYYEFKDAVVVNMLAKVPDGITVAPNEVMIDYADLSSSEASAQVTTEEGSHVSISKYEIIQEEGKEYFAISQSGKITVNSQYQGTILPGKYVLNLKLTTGAGVGIYENAVTFDITSKPLSLLYNPNSVKVEKNIEFISSEPTLMGSADDLSYQIKSITPTTSYINIDPQTGVITLQANNNLEIGTTCDVTITATNKYGSVDFENVLTINIVAFINPITQFSYTNQSYIQATAFSFQPASIDGDEISYEFVNLPAALTDQLTIEPTTGKISANQGNTIPTGDYTVMVKAQNVKSEKTSTFTLSVTKNPNFFTFVNYGNNLNLSPTKNYASQHRVYNSNELSALTLSPIETDLSQSVNVTWSIEKQSLSGVEINPDNGTLSFANAGWNNNKCFVIVVVTTAGEGAAQVQVKTPVFIHCSAAVNGVTVEYTPFVFQVNPKNGGTFVEPTISGVDNRANFLMDYRRTFNFYNIDGTHGDGQPKVVGSLMNDVWASYYTSIGSATVNTGAKAPLSFYDNSSALSQALGYIDNSNNQKLVINPNKWKGADGEFANGVMIGQMTFVSNGNEGGVSSGSQIFPIAIWFNEKF